MASPREPSKAKAYYDINAREVRVPRRVERLLWDGTQIGAPSSGWTASLLRECGLIEVTETPRPPDTRTTTHDRSVEMVGRTPTVVWTPRRKTPDELRGENVRELTDLQKVQAQLSEIKAFLDDPEVQAALDRPNNVVPTAQELNRTLKALIRQARRAANLDTRSMRYLFSQAHPELLDEDAE